MGMPQMKKINLIDMIGKTKLETILDAFTQATGVASIITDLDGTPITEPFNFSPLCEKYCRATVSGRHLCRQSDSYIGRESASKREIVTCNCLNSGLLDSAAPIIVDGMHIANVLCGQVLDSPISPEVAKQRALKIGVTDTDGYLRALSKVPIISYERFKAIVKLMEVVTQTISELAFQKYLLFKHSRRYLEKLINSVTDCIIATNNVGSISMVNDACVSTFGYSKEELFGRPIVSLFSDDASKDGYYQLVKMKIKDNPRAQILVKNNGNTPTPMQMSLSRINIQNQEMSGYVAVMRDVTEEKRTEKMKEDLLGMLTHDLGNPVLSIQKAMQLLADENLGPLNADQKEIMSLAYQTGDQLYGMVTDFLDTYRHENGQFLLRYIEFDIIQLVRESIKRVELFARDKALKLLFSSSLEYFTVYADQNRISRVFVNLLENAIKYSPENGSIKIKLSLINGNDAALEEKLVPELSQNRLVPGTPYLVLSISDEGLGINLSDQQLVFDKFFTTHVKNCQGRKGYGLGLTFCKLAVEAHGGQIGVMSPLRMDKVFKRKGCRFSFTLPA
jgi:PAS domain S-box-containing protein